ncbi:MAG: RNA polymerase-binding protein DksA [Candidatus Pelagibacterales bacterium]|jgi:DnaK suppressor protein|tara:strand:+ start:109 stop:522 length:414 start_codon:yes stop_codon:yes gene_type:complete
MATKLPKNYRPSQDEKFMNAKQREFFRVKLNDWKSEIYKESRETVENLQDSNSPADISDRATQESEKALELRTRDRQRKLIGKIDAAISRIDNGTYGYCEVTGEPIGLARLEARPVTTLSIEAQEMHERSEKLHSDD